MEKKGIATEKGELNRNIQKANRLIREIRAQIGKLKEWIADLFKAWETAPEQPQQSPGLANLLMKYLSVQREKSRKYSQRWQQQHTADELKTIAFCLDPETGFSWIGEYDITADELLSGAGGNTATKTEQAERLILDLLADGKELASEDIVKAAAEAGISERTVQNAKRNMGGVLGARRVGGQWYNFIKKKQ